jgi:hypothetical protein
MDDINADLGPDPETGDASVKSDRLRPVVRVVHRSSARWPAGFVLAMVVVLASSALALGAQVLPALQNGNPAASQMVGQPPSATPLVLEDDPTATPTLVPEETPTSGPTSPGLEPPLNPTDPPSPTPTHVPTPIVTSRTTPSPTIAPTIAPTVAPTPTATPVALDMGPLHVTANTNGTYTITWNAYTGPLNIYAYALCYTTNENVNFGSVEHFGGSIGISKTATTWTGAFPWAATLRVKVEAVYVPPTGAAQKAGETQVAIIPYTGATPTPTATATPTPTATPAPVDMGPLDVTANPNGTYTITWNAYNGPLGIGAYALCYTTNENTVFGYVEGFGGVISLDKTTSTWTGTFPWTATLRVKVEALYWPPAGRAQKAGQTQVGTVLNTGTATPTPTMHP